MSDNKSTKELNQADSELAAGENSQRGDSVAEQLSEAGNGAAAPGPEDSQGAEVTIESLQQALEEERRKVKAYKAYRDQLLRAKAEMENLRKRAARDVENAHKYGLERFVTEMLPVKDSLELGLSASEQGSDLASLKEGTELTLQMMEAAMKKCGVEEVNPIGEKFNPELHQAMTIQEQADAAPDSVVTVVQKGYLLNGRLIRPAMVVVAKKPQKAGS